MFAASVTLRVNNQLIELNRNASLSAKYHNGVFEAIVLYRSYSSIRQSSRFKYDNEWRVAAISAVTVASIYSPTHS